jgi:hypothetical protein
MRFKEFLKEITGVFIDKSNHNLKVKLSKSQYLYTKNKKHLQPSDDNAKTIVNDSKT